MTSGTRTGAGPVETINVTALPCCTSVPAGGSVAITTPVGTLPLDWLVMVGWKPAFRSLAAAVVAFSPTRSLRATLAGPPETMMLAAEPLSTVVPAGGVWLITRPVGTLVLEASLGTGSRPELLRLAPAACSLLPTTSGTVTVCFEPVSRIAATAPPAIRSASNPHSSARRRRRLASCVGVSPGSSPKPVVGASSNGADIGCAGGTWW